MRTAIVIAAVLAQGAVARAQTPPGAAAQVDQLSTSTPRTAAQPVGSAPAGARDPARVNQPPPAAAIAPLNPVNAAADRAVAGSQLSGSEAGRRIPGAPRTGDARTPTTQLSRSDPTTRSPAVPAATVDACEAILAGRRAPIAGLDCAAVMEAVAAAAPPQQSAESALLADTGVEQARRQGSARNTVARSPDADQIARQLATGDVQNAPVAQAVGAGFNVPAPAAPSRPVVVTPSGPGAPPVSVNPGR